MSSRQSSSSVRVCVPPSPLSSSFALTKNTKVGDLVERVVSACELGRRASYGLFLPLVPGTLPSDQAGAYYDDAAADDGDDEQDCEDVDGVWMRNNLLVSAYDLRPGDVLWLRRHRLDLSAVHASTVSYYTVISCPLQMILAEKKKLELQKPPSKARRSSSPTTLSRSSSSSPRVSADSDAFAAHLLATRRSPSPSVATPPLPDTPSPFLFPPMSPAGSDDDIAAPGHHRDDDDDDDNNNNNNNDNSGDLSDEDWQSCPKQPHRHSSWLGTTLGSLKADLARRHDVLAEYCLDTWKCFGCKEVPSSENERPSLEKEACSSSEKPPTALDSILPFEPLSAQLLSSSMAPRANGTARRLKTVAEKKPSPPPDAALPPAYQEFSLEAPLCQVLPWFADKETHETLYFQEPLRLCDPIVNLGPGGKTAIIVIPSVRQWKTMYFEEKTTVRDAIVALLCGLTHSRGARYGLYMQLKTGVEQRFSDLDSADQGLLRLRPESERLASFELSNAQHLVLREDASSAAPLPPVCPLPPAPLLPVSRQFTILQPGEARYDVVELFFAETISQAIRRIVRHRMLLRNFTPAARTAAADSPLAVGAAPSSLASSEPADQYSDDTAGRLLSTSSPNLLSTSILSPSAGFLSGSFLSSQLLVNPPASRPPRPPPSQSASSSSAASSDAADQFAAEFCLFLPPMLSRDFSRWLEPQRRLADYPEAFYTHQLELQPLPSSQKIVVLDGVDYQVVVHLSPSLSRADNASLFVMYDDRLTVHQAEIVLTHSIKNRTVEASSYALYLKTFADLGSLIDNHTDDELLIRAEKPAGPVNDDDELHVQQQRQQLQQEQQSLSSSSGGGLSWLSAAAESASRQIFSTSLPSLGSSLGAASSSSSSSSNSLPRPSSSTDAMPAAPRLQTTTSPTLVTTTEAQTSAPRSVAAGKEKKIWLNRDWKLIQYQISSNDVLTLKPRPTAVRLKEMIAAFTDLMQRPDLIPNEKVLLKDDHVMVPGRRDNQTLGSLVCTNYQIIFLPHSRSTYDEAMNLPNIHIPYATIARVTEIGGGGRTRGIEILCKDFRQMLFGFGMQSNKQRCSSFYKLISEQAFPVDRYGLRKGHEKLFAFASDEEYSRKESREDGWCLYSPKDDYARVGLCGSTSAERLWRLVSNARYELVPTYPSVFVIPRRVSMPDLLKIADFRIMRRIPATTWRHPNGATLTRCAQPSAGLGIQRCAPDENLVCALIENNANSSVLYIVDLRPMAVAVGHSVLGAGSESVASYAGCRLKFMGIGNIHAMTESCRKLQSLCGFEVEAPNWYALLSNSLWLNHISCVLQAAITIADWLDRQGCSVLIHCSDGWDRTAQVSALTQLLLDPHYRTMKGFMILVEKEWLSFGHKFAQRNSHGAKPQAQTSPIFMQFLDAVFQLCEQHPSAFEFNTDFLLEFVDHSYSCRFGTFLFNSEKERAEARVSERTASFWSYLNHNARRYVNPFYLIRESSRKADLGVAADSGKVIHKTQLLRITSTVSNLRLWRQCYLRWNMGYLPSLNKEREFVKLLQRYTATTAESSS